MSSLQEARRFYVEQEQTVEAVMGSPWSFVEGGIRLKEDDELFNRLATGGFTDGESLEVNRYRYGVLFRGAYKGEARFMRAMAMDVEIGGSKASRQQLVTLVQVADLFPWYPNKSESGYSEDLLFVRPANDEARLRIGGNNDREERYVLPSELEHLHLSWFCFRVGRAILRRGLEDSSGHLIDPNEVVTPQDDRFKRVQYLVQGMQHVLDAISHQPGERYRLGDRL